MSLVKLHAVRKSADVAAITNKSAKNDLIPFKQVSELLEKSQLGEQMLVITTLPRGSAQVIQPAKLAETLLKGYAKEFHAEDRLTWRAILEGRPVRAAASAAHGRYLSVFLEANGLSFAAAAPLKSPVLDGYPGAVHVYRSRSRGEFTNDDLMELGKLAQQIDKLVDQARAARLGEAIEPVVSLTPRPQGRVFVFDASGRQILSSNGYETFDARLRDEMSAEARKRLAKLVGKPTGADFAADRVQIADSRADLWNFRAVTYARYPAIADGPIAIFCLQPSRSEWSVLRQADFQADPELARLIPSLKFMRQEFHRGPTLTEISRTVHLSPFHFHRRFAELLGLTPKHYLLECQIQEAKVELLARRKELTQIAKDCGFAHQSHFTSRFKQATGLTPTRWRRSAGDSKRA